jgi:hypothetical protein
MGAKEMWDEKWRLSAKAAALEEAGDDAGARGLREAEEAAQAEAVALESQVLGLVRAGHSLPFCKADDCACGYSEQLDAALAAVWRRAMWRALDEVDCDCGRARCAACRGIARIFEMAHHPEVARHG